MRGLSKDKHSCDAITWHFDYRLSFTASQRLASNMRGGEYFHGLHWTALPLLCLPNFTPHFLSKIMLICRRWSFTYPACCRRLLIWDKAEVHSHVCDLKKMRGVKRSRSGFGSYFALASPDSADFCRLWFIWRGSKGCVCTQQVFVMPSEDAAASPCLALPASVIHTTLKGHAKKPTEPPTLSKRSLGAAVGQQRCLAWCKSRWFLPPVCRDGSSEAAAWATEQRLWQQKLWGCKKGKFGAKSETPFSFLTYKRG